MGEGVIFHLGVTVLEQHRIIWAKQILSVMHVASGTAAEVMNFPRFLKGMI